jgi:FkbH-like protein
LSKEKINTLDLLLGSDLPTRKQLKGIKNSSNTVQMRVERTFPFEYIASLLPAFLSISDLNASIEFSDYDPALTAIGSNADSAFYLLWIDWRLYREKMSATETTEWILNRIKELRSKTSKPIIVNNWPIPRDQNDNFISIGIGNRLWYQQINYFLTKLIEQPGVFLVDLDHLSYQFGCAFFDERNDEITKFPFSDKASIVIARHLGTQLIPSILKPRIKAIALDLDDTLYQGVIGEDGINGITITNSHIEFHKLLLALKNTGILLTICSRNVQEDVEEMFSRRNDLLLKYTDFSATEINWNSKVDNIQRLAKKLNIDPSAFLFVDDNPSELLKVHDVLPNVSLLRAKEDASETLNNLIYYPGIYFLNRDDNASLRTTDIQANAYREQLLGNSKNFSSYLESLQMVVTINVHNPLHSQRVVDMSNKTNQFNLGLKRLGPVEVDRHYKSQNSLIYTIELRDFLTDSGIIGAIIAQINGHDADILEVLFSCRALGREIETLSLIKLLENLEQRGVTRIRFDAMEGPRNKPSLEWILKYTKINTEVILSELIQKLQKDFNHPAKVEILR